MPKQSGDLSGAAKFSRDLSINLEQEFNKIKQEYLQNLYTLMPKDTGKAAKALSLSKSKRDGRKIWLEITLPNYMWEVWRGGERFISAKNHPYMSFFQTRFKNGYANGMKYMKFKNGYYMDGFYFFTIVHHEVKGVEGTPDDFIYEAFRKLDLSKFTQGVVTKMNNKRIYI